MPDRYDRPNFQTLTMKDSKAGVLYRLQLRAVIAQQQIDKCKKIGAVAEAERIARNLATLKARISDLRGN